MSTTPPPPPLQHFRIVKTISTSPTIRTTLCLPRDIEEPTKVDASALLTSIKNVGCSKLLSSQIGFVPQLILVHTAIDSGIVRSIANSILVSRSGACQISSEVKESWACELPVFGPTLMEFCKSYTIDNNGAGVPSYFLAHIFLEIIYGVCDGGVKKEVGAEHVRLNIHPGEDEEEEYVFRSYPSIILDTATSPSSPSPHAVARSVVELIRGIVFEWSDSAPFVKIAGPVMETTDPLLLIVGEMSSLIASNTPFGVEDLQARFADKLADLRLTGPERLPWHIAQHVHADLVGGEEMETAMREATVLRFEGRYHHEFAKLAAGEETEMGAGGHAGMRMNRIMVVKFGVRKGEFLRRVGEGEDVAMVDVPTPQTRM